MEDKTMRLNEELKSKIRNYFDNISAEELFNVLTEKFHMPIENEDIIGELSGVISYPCNSIYDHEIIQKFAFGDFQYMYTMEPDDNFEAGDNQTAEAA